MHVQLTKPRLAKFVDDKVKAGEFPSRQAVIESALINMMENEQTLTAEDMRAIRKSERQINRGEYVDFDEFAAKMRRKYRG